LLLVLHKAHGAHLAKVVMERGNTDARHVGEFLDAERSS
jgi:hypothetical protein